MLGANFEEISGVWDPLGFSKNGDEALYKYRCSEIKHGRVAQLAVIGMIMGDHITLPGDLTVSGLKFSDVPAGLGALSAVPPLGWAQILLFAGILELGPMKQDPKKVRRWFCSSGYLS
jgi:light-harvesting complex I chlorophyll a/b binding protein 1